MLLSGLGLPTMMLCLYLIVLSDLLRLSSGICVWLLPGLRFRGGTIVDLRLRRGLLLLGWAGVLLTLSDVSMIRVSMTSVVRLMWRVLWVRRLVVTRGWYLVVRIWFHFLLEMTLIRVGGFGGLITRRGRRLW